MINLQKKCASNYVIHIMRRIEIYTFNRKLVVEYVTKSNLKKKVHSNKLNVKLREIIAKVTLKL